MDELDKNIREALINAHDGGLSDDHWTPDELTQAITTLKQVFVKAGYIKLPNAQNITISTSDNPNDKLMTREQWDKEVNG